MTDQIPAAPAPEEGGPARSRIPRRAAVAATACLAVTGGALGIVGTRASSTPAVAASSATTTTTPSAKPSPRMGGHGRFPGGKFAGGGGFGPRFGMAGTVASVSSSGLVVTGPNSTKYTFTTSSSTVYREVDVTVGRSSLAVGEKVVVEVTAPASKASSSTRAAAGVEIVVPEIAGKVVSVSGSQVVVQDSEGFWRTIDVSSSTAYAEAGKSSSSTSAGESAVKTGVYIIAGGQIAGDHTTLDASAVAVLGTGPSAAHGGGPASFGPGGAFGGAGALGWDGPTGTGGPAVSGNFPGPPGGQGQSGGGSSSTD